MFQLKLLHGKNYSEKRILQWTRFISFAICCKNSCTFRETRGNFSSDPCSSDLYLAIYRAPSVIPLQCPFHRLHRNWINLKITRKDDRPVANAGNSPTFRPSYRVMRLGLTFARYRILYKVEPNIPSPFTNECRFLSNGRFFCIWFIWDFRDVTCSTLQL